MSSKVCLFLDSSLVAMCSLPNIPHSVFYHRKTGLTYLNVTQASGNDGVSGASLEPNPPPPPEGRPILGYRGAAEVRKTLTLLGTKQF